MEFSVMPGTLAPPHNGSSAKNRNITHVSPKKRIFDLKHKLAQQEPEAGPSEHMSDWFRLVDGNYLFPSLMQPRVNRSLSASRHLVFDTFSLKSSDGTMRHPTTVESDLIISLFPTTYSIGFLSSVLIIWCTKLPPKPWPATIAAFLHGSRPKNPHNYLIPLGMTGLKERRWQTMFCPSGKPPRLPNSPRSLKH
jgi:hypothetical protein